MTKEKGERQIGLRSIPPETSLDKVKKIEGMHGFHLRLGGGEPAELEWFGAQEKALTPVPKNGVKICQRSADKAEERREEEKERIREPTIDIFDEKDRIIVIAELAGVNEKDIKIETRGNELMISANSPSRKYRKTVKLPYEIKKKLKQRYKNGILEVVFRK